MPKLHDSTWHEVYAGDSRTLRWTARDAPSVSQSTLPRKEFFFLEDHGVRALTRKNRMHSRQSKTLEHSVHKTQSPALDQILILELMVYMIYLLKHFDSLDFMTEKRNSSSIEAFAGSPPHPTCSCSVDSVLTVFKVAFRIVVRSPTRFCAAEVWEPIRPGECHRWSGKHLLDRLGASSDSNMTHSR